MCTAGGNPACGVLPAFASLRVKKAKCSPQNAPNIGKGEDVQRRGVLEHFLGLLNSNTHRTQGESGRNQGVRQRFVKDAVYICVPGLPPTTICGLPVWLYSAVRHSLYCILTVHLKTYLPILKLSWCLIRQKRSALRLPPLALASLFLCDQATEKKAQQQRCRASRQVINTTSTSNGPANKCTGHGHMYAWMV